MPSPERVTDAPGERGAIIPVDVSRHRGGLLRGASAGDSEQRKNEYENLTAVEHDFLRTGGLERAAPSWRGPVDTSDFEQEAIKAAKHAEASSGRSFYGAGPQASIEASQTHDVRLASAQAER